MKALLTLFTLGSLLTTGQVGAQTRPPARARVVPPARRPWTSSCAAWPPTSACACATPTGGR